MPDFLLIHDMGHGGWAWDYVIGALQDALRRQARFYHALYQPGMVLAPDLPYHGARQGQGDPQVITIDTAVDELVEGAEQAQLNSPTVVAHGLSGLIGLEVARRLKTRPRRVVLIGASVPSFVGTVTETLPLAARLAVIAHMLRPGTEPGTIRLHREVAWRLWCRGMDYPAAAVLVLGKLGPIPLKLLDALPHPDALRPAFPVAYMALRRDGLLPYRSQVRMAESLKAEVAVLDAGHEAPLSHPQQIADLLLRGEVASASRRKAAGTAA